jgi:hypothetical protein
MGTPAYRYRKTGRPPSKIDTVESSLTIFNPAVFSPADAWPSKNVAAKAIRMSTKKTTGSARIFRVPEDRYLKLALISFFILKP